MNFWTTAFIVMFLIAAQAGEVPKKKKKEQTAFEKVLETMFPSSKAKVVPKPKPKQPEPRKKTQPKTSAPVHSRIYVDVSPEWMARYWEQESAWDYYIPEDDLIKFESGVYKVPIVVFRHNEDMEKTPRRSFPSAVSPQSNER